MQFLCIHIILYMTRQMTVLFVWRSWEWCHKNDNANSILCVRAYARICARTHTHMRTHTHIHTPYIYTKILTNSMLVIKLIYKITWVFHCCGINCGHLWITQVRNHALEDFSAAMTSHINTSYLVSCITKYHCATSNLEASLVEVLV